MIAWLRTWFLLALTAWPVGMLVLAVHAALGHGLVAELTGGRLLSIYVSPAAAEAVFFAPPGARRLVAVGAAAPLTAAVGLLTWRATRRSTHFVPRVAGWYSGLGAIGNLAWWGLCPWLLDRSGHYGGDWSEVWRALGVPSIVPGLLAAGLIAFLSALLLGDARRLVTAHQAAPGRRGLTASYGLMVSAAGLPVAAYALAFWPYWRPTDLTLLAGALAFPLVVWAGGLVAMPFARRLVVPVADASEAGPSEPEPGSGLRMPDAPTTLACFMVLIATTVGAAWLFGPATRLRAGFAVRALTSDDYWEIDSRTEVEWAFEADGAGRLTVRSSPPVSSPSEFVEREAGAIDRLGPSRAACDRMLTSVAGLSEGVTLTGSAAAPDRSQGAWRCVAPARAEERGLEFVVPARAAAMSVIAPGLATRRYSAQGVALALSTSAARWVRPEGFHGTDAVRVKF
ncbi:MAG TPA: hypothetical protein VMQ62_10535 [Dongiaceae bacterium]|nr:hypothetical protein [Dongiaceae bacterium]